MHFLEWATHIMVPFMAPCTFNYPLVVFWLAAAEIDSEALTVPYFFEFFISLYGVIVCLSRHSIKYLCRDGWWYVIVAGEYTVRLQKLPHNHFPPFEFALQDSPREFLFPW